MKNFYVVLIILLNALILYGCVSAVQHARDVDQATSEGDRLSVGKVQREIQIGMPNADVVTVLGSPNIVTTDEKRREVWVYDKISTTRAYSTSKAGVGTLVLGGGPVGEGIIGGGVGGSYGSAAGAMATEQKTLTVIIKFDDRNRVRDFAYHTSRF